jgi:hypothetical protein
MKSLEHFPALFPRRLTSKWHDHDFCRRRPAEYLRSVAVVRPFHSAHRGLRGGRRVGRSLRAYGRKLVDLRGPLARACRGARVYNAFHTYTLPIILGLLAVTTHAGTLVPYALIWVNHIGIDRGLGYGLKFSQGFGWTHLGIKGRARLESSRGGCSEAQTQP